MGPSYGNPGERNVPLSAVQLARLANVRPQDIRYWAKRGYLGAGELEEGTYELGQLPKARLMALFTKRLEMNAGKSSQLADEFLRRYEDRPDAFTAMIAVVQALDTRITDFVKIALDIGLVSKIGKMLEKGKRKAPT
jgi:DNA-binding transcriptional MerR regulator